MPWSIGHFYLLTVWWVYLPFWGSTFLWCAYFSLIILKSFSWKCLTDASDGCMQMRQQSCWFLFLGPVEHLSFVTQLNFFRGGWWIFNWGITDIHFPVIQYLYILQRKKRKTWHALRPHTGLTGREGSGYWHEQPLCAKSGYVICWTNIKCHKSCCNSVTQHSKL